MSSSLTHPKSQLSGWRIEQKYSNGVLVGNWSEDRFGKFKRGQSFTNTTHRGDFQLYPSRDYVPDVSTRRQAQLRSDGLNKDLLFRHHGDRYNNNMISMYDQQFNRKYGMGGRAWDRNRLSWLPEVSDHPMQGKCTNFGLKEEVERKWKKLEEIERRGDYTTLYSIAYSSPPKGTQVFPRATPRHLSSHLHPHKIHKDLHFRGSPLTARPEVVDPRLFKKLAATV
ncbi:cilia- and flagella-associated protein 107-like [Halichondria panicea]|uniref:cilia- and flagella-associated protein 107-like n=1 Tax=Halichondria panicea TaxID=6063 RepID=UPI00312B6EAD